MLGQMIYSPSPSISLGDIERIIEVSEESNIESEAVEYSADEILDSFKLIVNEAVLNNSNRADTEEDEQETQANNSVGDEVYSELFDSQLRIGKMEQEAEALRTESDKLRAEAEAVKHENEVSHSIIDKQKAELLQANEELKRLREQTEAAEKRAAEASRQALETERRAAEASRQALEAERQSMLKEREYLDRVAAEHKDRELELQRMGREQLDRERIEVERLRNENRIKAEEAKKKEIQNQTAASNARKEKLRQLEELQRKAELCNSSSHGFDYYLGLEPRALFEEVRKFAEEKHMTTQVIPRSMLNDKFGRENIMRLINKSYLIPMGKGVTFGNV